MYVIISIYFKFTSLIISFQKKKKTKLHFIDHVKLLASLSTLVPVPFKIIVKLDYLEK